jgi:hypothetical protein
MCVHLMILGFEVPSNNRIFVKCKLIMKLHVTQFYTVYITLSIDVSALQLKEIILFLITRKYGEMQRSTKRSYGIIYVN